ncbi:MAG: hypothetical protein HQM12_21830 [SAR324 cluster bacterium]|nr:hypothetical protein [SAR324 cluster bacterium]
MNDICKRLHEDFNHLNRFSFPFNPHNTPSNGIYILFEKGERAHGMDRIVRVGTHTGNNQLPSRLQQHFIQENKDRSIFRKNIGRALLNLKHDPFLQSWELDLTSRANKDKYEKGIDPDKKKATERSVTEYIQANFSFVVLKLNDKDQRLDLESKLISTVSLCPQCPPSPQWLGQYSPKIKIRESGLWLVNELYKQPLSEGEYQYFKQHMIQN